MLKTEVLWREEADRPGGAGRGCNDPGNVPVPALRVTHGGQFSFVLYDLPLCFVPACFCVYSIPQNKTLRCKAPYLSSWLQGRFARLTLSLEYKRALLSIQQKVHSHLA